jgi:TldD protein
MKPDLIGKLRYGSKEVSIVADPTVPGAYGTFAYDDEGVRATCIPLIKDGIFVGQLTSREPAHELGLERSGGTARAESARYIPMIRGTNVNILPGKERLSLEDMIADTDKGILIDTDYSWSIDHNRLNFQFGGEIGWLIVRGKRVKVLRAPTYSGTTTSFWRKCDAICSKEETVYWGVPNCGKGQPCQSVPIAHGAQPARFRRGLQSH